jgi:hypothetical protein
MNLGDLLEWAINRDWSPRWVAFRALLLALLVVFFRSSFTYLFNLYVHWKTTGLTREFQHLLPSPAPTPGRR